MAYHLYNGVQVYSDSLLHRCTAQSGPVSLEKPPAVGRPNLLLAGLAGPKCLVDTHFPSSPALVACRPNKIAFNKETFRVIDREIYLAID